MVFVYLVVYLSNGLVYQIISEVVQDKVKITFQIEKPRTNTFFETVARGKQ